MADIDQKYNKGSEEKEVKYLLNRLDKWIERNLEEIK